MKRKYNKPKIEIHGDIKELTKGDYEGMSDANTGDSIPPPPP